MNILTDWITSIIVIVIGYMLLGKADGDLVEYAQNSSVGILIGIELAIIIVLTIINVSLEKSGRPQIFGMATMAALATVLCLLQGGIFNWGAVAIYGVAGLFGIFSLCTPFAYALIVLGIGIEFIIHYQDWLGTYYLLEEDSILYIEYTFWRVYIYMAAAAGALLIPMAIKIVLAMGENKKANKKVDRSNDRFKRNAISNDPSQMKTKSREPEIKKDTVAAPINVPKQTGTQVLDVIKKDENGEKVEGDDLGGILESITYFMAKNFKCTSALAFLSEDQGKTFKLNSAVSNSNAEINKSVVIQSGIGLLGKASQLELGMMSGNLRNYPDKLEYYVDSSHVNSAVVTKIIDDNGSNVIGLLVVDSMDLQAFYDEDKNLMNRFSKIAAKLISNIQMSKKLITHNRRVELIYGVSKKIAEEMSPNGVLKTLMQNLKEIFPADKLVLCDYQPEVRKGRVVKIFGKDNGPVKSGMVFDLTNENSVYAKSFKNKTHLRIDEFKNFQTRFITNDLGDVKSMMVAPILNDKEMVVAIIGIESNTLNQYTEEDLTLLKTLMINSSSSLAKAQMFKNMERQATIDGLTQIPNHRSFQDTADKMIVKSQEEDKPLGLLLMDIDHFKKFNDTYGHPIGDLVLKQVATAIKKSIRVNDFVARYGGEEFIVLLNGLDVKQAMESAERIRKAVEDLRIVTEAGTLSVQVSIGCCMYPDVAPDKATLVDNADKALYTSKENGRNQVTLFKK